MVSVRWFVVCGSIVMVRTTRDGTADPETTLEMI